MLRMAGVFLLALALAGCAGKSGLPFTGTLPPDIGYAYIPLHQDRFVVFEGDAGAVALGGGVAVTAAHAIELVPDKDVIGVSKNYDLAFFRTERRDGKLAISAPQVGAAVLGYAHYEGQLYQARGTITDLKARVLPRCEGCPEQLAFTFEGNAGPGYSGGPVLDAEGRLIGILFGYVDQPDGKRLLYAYPMDRVQEELKKAEAK